MMWSLLSLCVLVGQTAVAQEAMPGLNEVTEGMQKRYESVDNVVVNFTQQLKLGFSKIEQRFSGTLTMRKPNRYRVEAEHQTLVTDGFTVWAYSPSNKQVLIDRYKENQNSISPDRFLLNIPSDYYASVLGLAQGKEKKLIILKLVPKDDRSFIKSVKMWVEEDSWVVGKIQIIDVNDTENLYTINDLKFNSNLNNALFTFIPPPGTEVVDLR